MKLDADEKEVRGLSAWNLDPARVSEVCDGTSAANLKETEVADARHTPPIQTC
jgi:hypothetical protein